VSWLNVFDPKRVEALPNGAVLLVTWPTAADFASDEARVAQARAHVHLRPELDFSTVLRTLRERSATLAPWSPASTRTRPRSSAALGRTPSRERRPAGTRAGRTPRSAAPPQDSCARRLLAPRPGVRYLLLTGPPHSHTRARRLRKALQWLLEGLSSSWARAAPNSTGRTVDTQLFGSGPGALPLGVRELQVTGPRTRASWRPSTIAPALTAERGGTARRLVRGRGGGLLLAVGDTLLAGLAADDRFHRVLPGLEARHCFAELLEGRRHRAEFLVDVVDESLELGHRVGVQGLELLQFARGQFAVETLEHLVPGAWRDVEAGVIEPPADALVMGISKPTEGGDYGTQSKFSEVVDDDGGRGITAMRKLLAEAQESFAELIGRYPKTHPAL